MGGMEACDMEKRDTLFIGGEFVTPESNKTIEVISPYTEEVIGVAPEAGEADVDRAVAAAETALAAPPPAREGSEADRGRDLGKTIIVSDVYVPSVGDFAGCGRRHGHKG